MAVKRYNGTAWVIEAGAAAPLPSGMLAPFAGSTAPAGWLLSDGSAISRATYSGLFAAIGTTYGVGDNSTTFNLPDLRGRTIAALDNMGGTDASRLNLANTLGTTAGTQTHTLTTGEIPGHSHPNTAAFTGTAGTTGNDSPDHAHNITWDGIGAAAGGISVWGLQGNSNPKSTGGATARHQHSFTPAGTVAMTNANNIGGGGAHNNMQPTILMNYIIKV
jgi:microcystin-dependent protein